MKQGLIGSKLKQSYSKYIHEKINHLHYSLKEISNILKNLALNDYKMKSGRIEADMLIDLLILNI